MADTQAEFEQRLEVFFGNASRTMCHVYARLPAAIGEPGSQLTGKIVGPSCAYAKTLPAAYALADCGPGDSLLSLAKLPEPSFWTPEMPHEYQVEVTWRVGETILGWTQRTIGIRPLGTRGSDLVLDGKRWVLRGIRQDSVAERDLQSWRDCSAALVVGNPASDLCREASRAGILLVAELAGGAEDEMQRLSRFAAVGIVVLPLNADAARVASWNLLLAERFHVGQAIRPAPWAQVVLCEIEQIEAFAAQTRDCSLPVIAVRPAYGIVSVEHARKLCDLLQRDLAGRGNVCGYIV